MSTYFVTMTAAVTVKVEAPDDSVAETRAIAVVAPWADIALRANIGLTIHTDDVTNVEEDNIAFQVSDDATIHCACGPDGPCGYHEVN